MNGPIAFNVLHEAARRAQMNGADHDSVRQAAMILQGELARLAKMDEAMAAAEAAKLEAEKAALKEHREEKKATPEPAKK